LPCRDGFFDKIHQLINNRELADIHRRALEELCRFCVGRGIECENKNVGTTLRGFDVSLADIADAFGDDLDEDFFLIDFCKFVMNAVERADRVRFYDQWHDDAA
jgi:hypothetical protein